MSEEIFDIVNLHDQVIGQATRSVVHSTGLLHRAVHILLFNCCGELLVQKRAATKDTFPGCFDSSASGHLSTGEDYDTAAYREVNEELGVILPEDILVKCFKIEACKETGQEFVWIYTAQSDAVVIPNLTEVESVVAMSRAQVENLLNTQPETCAPAFRRVFREFCEHGFADPKRNAPV